MKLLAKDVDAFLDEEVFGAPDKSDANVHNHV